MLNLAKNLNDVQEAQDFVSVPAGGYICMITSVDNLADKQYIKLEYDIVEGDFKDHFDEIYQRAGFWGLSNIQSYKETALGFFKRFITAVESSNPGFIFDNDEVQLKGKTVGLVLFEEEYEGNDGVVKTRLKVDRARSVESIRKGDFKVPPKKLLSPTSAASAQSADIPDDLPFN